MIEYVTGNMFLSDCGVICHYVNGSGISYDDNMKFIKSEYPECYSNYKETCKLNCHKLEGIVNHYPINDDQDIATLYLLAMSNKRMYAMPNYDAIRLAFGRVKLYAETNNRTVGLPWVPSDMFRNPAIATCINEIIKEVFESSEIKCFIYK